MTTPIRLIVALIGVACLTSSRFMAQAPGERVLIRAAKPYGALVSRIESAGGRVTHRFKHIEAVAATIPLSAMPAIHAMAGDDTITKDVEIQAPRSVDTFRGKGGLASSGGELAMTAENVDVIAAEEIPALADGTAAAYRFNLDIANVAALHAAGVTGQEMIVAVIDTGIRPGFPHISLDGSVAGCEDFVGDALGCSNLGNDGHGTFVAGMISANAVFTFSPDSLLRNAVLAECPTCFSNPPINTQIAMIGTAPMSRIYALRIYGASGSSLLSRAIAAIERVIDLREQYDAGHGGQNIQVCNLSIAFGTLFAGRDLLDQAIDVMLSKDILPVVAAGNAGPSSLTTGSPGSAIGALTVGAASLAHAERIIRRVQFGPEVGALFRPFSGTQIAFFSSRGPNADGRPDPDVVANGFGNYGQGHGATTLEISLDSGTSSSAPSVAGVATLLRQAHPGATARQVRQAIINSANVALITDGSTQLDQGSGHIDAGAASLLLASGGVPDDVPEGGRFSKSVKVNVEKQTPLDVRDGVVDESITGLLPGERADLLYRIHANVQQVVIAVDGVTPALPPNQQNQLFGDDILLAVHSAQTSAIGEGDYLLFEFTTGGTFVVNDPEPGLMRVTINGDWTNAGAISANVRIFSVVDSIPGFTSQGRIMQSQTLVFPITMPRGVSQAEFRTGWHQDWGNYPTADIDMILVAPNGVPNFAGSTLRNPERVVVNNPAAGQWVVLVDGFDIPAGHDQFELRVSLDGHVVK